MTNSQTTALAVSPNGSNDERFAFLSRGYKDAWAGVQRALVTYDDVFVMTAPEGAGKTTLLANFLCNSVSAEVFVAAVSTTDLQGGSLFDYMRAQLGIPDEAPDKLSMLEQLGARLGDYKHAVLAIDDAHALTDSEFRELLELCYLRRTLGPMLQVFLVGEDDLLATLESSELVQMNLWRAESHQLASLSLRETGEFIQGWFEHQEGARGPVFTADAIGLIHRWSRGTPGRLTRFCHWFAHHGSEQDWQDELGREEVRKGIRGQMGLEILDAHAPLAMYNDSAAAALQSHPRETADVEQDDAGDAPPAEEEEKARPGSTTYVPHASQPGEDASPDSTVAEPAAAILSYGREPAGNPEEPRARRGVATALYLLGLFVAFQLGGYFSGPAATPSEVEPQTAPRAAERPEVSAWLSPIPYVLPSLAPVPLRTGAENAVTSPAPVDTVEETVEVSVPEPGIAAGEPAIRDEVEPAYQSTREEEAAVAASARAAKIENLLRLGGQALERVYLSTPREESAWHYYRQVLTLDPGNTAATLGVQLIIAKYAELTRRVIGRGDLASAQVFIDRGLGIAPRDASLMRLQAEVDAARTQKIATAEQQPVQDDEKTDKEDDGAVNPLQWLERLYRNATESREP